MSAKKLFNTGQKCIQLIDMFSLITYRAELIFSDAMMDFPEFTMLETKVNQVYSFYHSSSRRWGDFEDYAKDNDFIAIVQLYQIFQVR